ncbi:PTS system lactose/cellobiose-specific IIA component [Spiroplasma clarkii]|uniref:PTS system, cellobiose-specific IIA component n=1 Tax=Spiroplasma clarkii TaxID=2139 RepID=A0A1Y0L014_9MOLU|nr:PTS lactose/cellobiose transporter subunit IIA [Spiroplasma clarkii]ARU91337.1 PTS system lactose/cellobiose-specific IIA component [Spiroplasma clarkii]ATX70762.1 PTS system, cellobiose-specific IIA component [Spiroplasma clarkii]
MAKIDWNEISMNMIAYSGEAKSLAVFAIEKAENNQVLAALQDIKDAEELLISAEKLHLGVIVQEAQGIKLEFKILFMHAEDQMLSTQFFILTAKKLINLHQKVGELTAKLAS